MSNLQWIFFYKFEKKSNFLASSNTKKVNQRCERMVVIHKPIQTKDNCACHRLNLKERPLLKRQSASFVPKMYSAHLIGRVSTYFCLDPEFSKYKAAVWKPLFPCGNFIALWICDFCLSKSGRTEKKARNMFFILIRFFYSFKNGSSRQDTEDKPTLPTRYQTIFKDIRKCRRSSNSFFNFKYIQKKRTSKTDVETR